jgi:hypothetical protein
MRKFITLTDYILVLESILPTKFFPVFAIKLGRFIAKGLLSYVTNTQA